MGNRVESLQYEFNRTSANWTINIATLLDDVRDKLPRGEITKLKSKLSAIQKQGYGLTRLAMRIGRGQRAPEKRTNVKASRFARFTEGSMRKRST
jgi:hypothetical protein